MKIRFCFISIIICLSALSAQAQERLQAGDGTTGISSVRQIYSQAESEYNIGRIEQAVTILQSNIDSFHGNLRQSVFRLMALCNLGLDNVEKAEEATRNLLNEDPYYTASPQDPQRFIDMVENLRSGITATITTASSQAENLNEVPVPTTLITEEMIRNSGARNLQEVLAIYVPSMNIIDCNDDINISMRGIYSNGQEKILIMLNGHRLNSYSINIAAPDFSMSLEKLKQIEVLRGPASSLYGGVSLTAVVNLITKQGADIDGVKVKAGIGNHGQLRGDLLFGKRYFDLDMLVWGSFYKAKGEERFITKEQTALPDMYGHAGDITIGGIGDKPSYDYGISLKYKNLRFLYNTQFSQIQSPMAMTYLFAPYEVDKYKTYDGIRPSFATTSHHADLSYGQQFHQVYLKGVFAYDNSDMAHYQVISDTQIPGFVDLLPLPESSQETLRKDAEGGYSRYMSGQEHTFGAKLQGDWSYLNNKNHKGLLSAGMEYSYFEMEDARYTFGYNFKTNLPETIPVSDLGKGHENSFNTYVQLKHQWKSFIVNAGLRFDYKHRFDTTNIREFSPRVALIYVQPKWNVKLSYSKAYIDAPYYYRKSNIFLHAFAGMMGASALLDPETMHSYQLTFGATQWAKGLNFEVNAFYNKARNNIHMNLLDYSNDAKSDIYGIEFSGSYERPRFSAHLSSSWQKSHMYMIYGEEMDYPLNTPEFSANSVLTWRATKQLKLHTRLGYYSKQHTQYYNIVNYVMLKQATDQFSQLMENIYRKYPSDPIDEKGLPISISPEDRATIETVAGKIAQFGEGLYNKKDIDPYFLVDIGANYTWGKLDLAFNIHNLFNRKYEISGASTGLIPQKGRWFLFDIAYRF